MEEWFIPYQTQPLRPAQRVLIVAPHPDDEIFGCGGAAYLYRKEGAQVSVLVLTDGAGNAPENERAQIFATRQAETNEALCILDVPQATFWGLPDRGLSSFAGLSIRLANFLQTNAFDCVFTPSLSEVHPDHKACTQAVLAALEQLQPTQASTPELVFYEVGVPLQPNWLLDITPAWAFKKRAMQCFASQQTSQDYASHVQGLNTYRTYTLEPHIKQAEAYRIATPEDQFRGALHHGWTTAVLSAAEASAEAMRTQLVTQNRLITDLQNSSRQEREASAREHEKITTTLLHQLSDALLKLQNAQWQIAHQTKEITGLNQQVIENQSQANQFVIKINDLQWTIEHQSNEITDLTQQLVEHQAQASQFVLNIQDLQWTINHQAKEISDLITETQTVHLALKEHQAQLHTTQQALHSTQEELSQIKSALWWRITNLFKKLLTRSIH